jgi:hypothetical protein
MARDEAMSASTALTSFGEVPSHHPHIHLLVSTNDRSSLDPPVVLLTSSVAIQSFLRFYTCALRALAYRSHEQLYPNSTVISFHIYIIISSVIYSYYALDIIYSVVDCELPIITINDSAKKK